MTDEIIEVETTQIMQAPQQASNNLTVAGGGFLPDPEEVFRRAKHIKKIFAAACGGLSPKNIVDFGGQPYIDHIACKRIATLFNLKVQQFHNERGVIYKKEVLDEANNHYIIRVSGKAYFIGNPSEYEVYEGSADSFGDWFRQWQIVEDREIDGKTKKIVVSAQTLPQTKVEEKATANLLQKAVKKMLGLDFTWEELEAAGVERSKCKGFNFNGNKGADSTETVELKQAVWNKIVEICNGNTDLAKKTLQKHTKFGEFAGHTDINKVSEKQLTFLSKKVDEAYQEYLKALENGGAENGDN